MSVHLREHYGHSIPQLQFDALLDLCDRAMPGTEHKGEHCRFCDEVISLDEAQDHLGSHMETLALFVLPNNDDVEEDVASENSIQAELSDPESGTNGGKSEKSSPSIYAPESPKTTSPFFTDVLPVEEMDIVSKFAAWSVEEDESNPINVRGIDSSPPDDGTEHSDERRGGGFEKGTEEKYWYCRLCKDGPIGSWQNCCVACGHAKGTEKCWYCSACQDGPIGLWQNSCVACGHARCRSCNIFI
jgi:hypothetical protein